MKYILVIYFFAESLKLSFLRFLTLSLLRNLVENWFRVIFLRAKSLPFARLKSYLVDSGQVAAAVAR